jgi:uncharacterized repeat protein (TIGR01451 family)
MTDKAQQRGGPNVHSLRRFGVLLATAGLLATSLFVGVAGVAANTVDPAGCEDNGIDLTISRSPAIVQPGDMVTYTVSVTNGVSATAPKPCNVTNATVTIELPDNTTGLPNGSPEILVANHDFPADHTGDIGPLTRTFTIPAGPLGYGSATARAAITGSILHDSEFVDDSADISKTSSATIVDANIQITPNGTNEVGDPHTFTVHVNTKVGTTGYVNAANGTVVDLAIAGGGVGSLSASSCTTSGGTGSCSVTDTSAVPGVDVVTASVDTTLAGKAVSRSTNGSAGNSGPATKTWVDANIEIGPNGTNPVGHTHTFTGHVKVNDGSGWENAPNGTEIAFKIDSGPGGFTSTNPCLTSGGTGSCTIDLVSNVVGTTNVSAETNLSVGGVALKRTTDGTDSNSDPAIKHWTDRGVTTDIHAGSGEDDDPGAPAIANAEVGSTVHDQATVTGSGDGTPTGTVTFTVYLGNTSCEGEGTSAGTVQLDNNGVAHPSNDVTVPAGGLSFMAHYNGDDNFAAADGSCEPLTALSHSLVIDKSNNAPIETLELPGGTFADLPTADEGDTVTYTLHYTFSASPDTQGIIWDMPPAGVTYVPGSATNSDNGEFVFVGYGFDPTLAGCPGSTPAAGPFLIWKADNVTQSGTITYKATVDVGASALAQPLHNPVCIISNETPKDDSASDVYVPAPPQQETNTPPPTDAIVRTDGTSTPGLSLWLALGGLGILIVGLGFITPVPARVRRRRNR